MTFDPLQDAASIRRYLDAFDRVTTARGRTYFRDGAVRRLELLDAGARYLAVVRGGRDYEVTLHYKDGEWKGECSCPIGSECKHIYAALLAFQQHAGKFQSLPLAGGGASHVAAAAKQTPRLPTVQPSLLPVSPLVARVTETLGREPNAKESDYLRKVQALFQEVNENHVELTLYDLTLLADDLHEHGWQPLELWPTPPRDDHEFWLYCARELRNRGVALPDFMRGATDFSAIDASMNTWLRDKEVTHWRARLEQASSHFSSNRDFSPLDLRLMLLRERVVVQCRAAVDQPFQDIKQTQVRRWMHEYENGTLQFQPEAALIWIALYKPYDYQVWNQLDYASAGAKRLLNRVLRQPALAERVVNAQGVPWPRVAEALRFDLAQAEGGADGDYRLRLARADGSALPEIWLTLPGQPTVYLVPDAIYTGPQPHGLGMDKELNIPAPALESPEGVGFVAGLGLELPQRLAARTRRVEVKVNVYCDLKPTYPGATTEAVFVGVAATQDGEPFEQLHPHGWRPRDAAPVSKAQGAASPELIPLLDRAAQSHFPRLLELLGAKWDNHHLRWRVKLNRNFPDIFVPWLAALPAGVEIYLDRELASFRDAPMAGSIRLDVEEAGVDWFDLKVVLDVSDIELTPEELKLLLNARGGYVRLGKKGWRRLEFNLTDEEEERLARLGLDARDFTAEPQRLHALQLADEAAKRFLPEQHVERIQRRVSELKARVNPPLPAAIRAELRPYQVEGFHFLAYLAANRFGGVLADDMGLGKTLQTLTWLAWLREESLGDGQARIDNMPKTENGPLSSVVVCPKSVMDNWRAEAERFLPGLRVRLWRGEDVATLNEARAQSDLIVMNYSQLRALSPEIAKLEWHAAILDEAQCIKNPDSQTAQSARALRAEHRLALTGTPIENRLLDLWSILAFCMPGVLGNRAQFTRMFDVAQDPLARRRLAARVRPFLLRRTKNQVAKDLPDRIEEDLFCELEAEQKALYRAEFKRAQQLLLKVRTKQDLNENRFNFLTALLRLRQICCHPALVDASLRQAESAKLNALIDVLEPLMEEGHKVLVFSQFVIMLDLLRETVKARDWPHFYLAGETENRGELVQEFQTAKGAAIFLISLKAGGFGLNLTAASYVVLYDPWWNPAVETQAIDRTHRIGQRSKVIAYRLLMKNSIEEKIRKLQKSKAALAEDVLGEETFAKSLTLEDLRYLFAEE